jgi:hypothetical protein
VQQAAPVASSLGAGGPGPFTPPPVAPANLGNIGVTTPDLLNSSADAVEFVEQQTPTLPPGAVMVPGAQVPPTFHNVTRRSTRFVTSVPAHEVLEKVATVLDQCHRHRSNTAIGPIGEVKISWDNYYLETRAHPEGPHLFALQLFRLDNQQTADAIASSPGLAASPMDSGRGVTSSATDLYVVEFIRGSVEIFHFKRFYSWLRAEISELIKRDASHHYVDPGSSPMINDSIMSRYAHILGPGNSDGMQR